MKPGIYWINNSTAGKLGIALRPRGGDWLTNEIQNWKRAGVDVAVSMLMRDEEEELGLRAEKKLCREQGIEFHSLPVPDRGVPKAKEPALKLAARLHHELEHGRNVIIHCRQSVGRSSLLATAVLMQEGISPSVAIHDISMARKMEVP